MESKSEVDPNDRENRIHARRGRIEMRNANKDDENKKKKSSSSDTKKMSRGAQQIADSLNQLDKRKITGIQEVTDIRVRADDTENNRRINEEDRKQKRIEKLQQEAITSGSRNAEVEMRWADLYDYNMPQELFKQLQLQSEACGAILASKDALIKDFQTQLKAKDEEYVVALKVQADDVETLVDRMSQQYREMQEEYELELEQIEDAFLKERDELISTNKSEIDSLFEKRREMEMTFMEAKQARDELSQKEIEDLRVKDAEDYNKLKIKLETDIQTLEQQLEEMRATYQLNTEKLEYNYRVLTERDMENSATLNQQKRKLSRLKDALSGLIQKYTQTDAQQRHQNTELTEDYRRITKQYKDLQKKFQHFEDHDGLKYSQVWEMHRADAMDQIEKVLQADKIIHEQQLGLVWVRPFASQHPDLSRPAQVPPQCDLRYVDAGDHKAARSSVEDGSTNSTTDDSGGPSSDGDNSRKVSSSKLKCMLKMLASEAGFLVHTNVLQAIDTMDEDEAELVRADSILRSLGVESEGDMERLLGYFFHDTAAADDEVAAGDERPLGLKVQADQVIQTIKFFVDELNKEKKAQGSRPRRAAKEKIKLVDDMQGESRKEDKLFWPRAQRILPDATQRVWLALEKGLTEYNMVLKQRKSLIDSVSALQVQNSELKALLRQYLGSSVNDELLIPPTQMIRVQEPRHGGM
ncbi:hypothetical protein H310_05515 [Aphanomyces invadans]|uniref:Dynein regulatory complex protein 1/2 N-terminal domain-containing protein n=1 Tax=Aphanomyces invadans TaxID=157072 RepID=A0A024UBS7_9STRA|nr:hypothetical protein H310_05515 [Aphanomyces invadans]ETW03088.1 hypothetical protein H310_05515 [Aphanomyces invadans]|eukprot:XP_008868472.1 hypothetical protein H310_05515 [Aphanomyces invadans]